jgi:hypothetical protein
MESLLRLQMPFIAASGGITIAKITIFLAQAGRWRCIFIGIISAPNAETSEVQSLKYQI